MARHCVISVDTAGLEPATSHCTDIVVDAGALPFKSYASCDSFLVYQLGEPDPGVDGHPLLTLNQLFHRWVKIYDRQLGELKI